MQTREVKLKKEATWQDPNQQKQTKAFKDGKKDGEKDSEQWSQFGQLW